MKRLVLSLAQGFGLGRIRVAPGTFGSVAGMLWFFLLASLPGALLFAAGAVFAISLSVWLTGDAERILQSKDPSSVVLDEIVAVPACFVSWMLIAWLPKGHWPGPDFFFGSERWLATLGVFGAFRFFDILKPWPVRQVQSLPGGYGVVFDDLAAAAYVNLCVGVVYWVRPSWLI